MARELNARERALKDAEGQLIQSEKMAAQTPNLGDATQRHSVTKYGRSSEAILWG